MLAVGGTVANEPGRGLSDEEPESSLSSEEPSSARLLLCAPAPLAVE